MEKNRTKIIGVRVTESEMEQIKTVAKLNKKKVSEWCYQVMLKAANKQNDIELELLNLGDRVILEQLILLRIVLTNSLLHRELTEDKLKRVIRKADEVKSEKVKQLIREFISEGILKE